MAQVREHTVLYEIRGTHPDSGNAITLQVTWTTTTGYSFGVYDRDDFLDGQVELFDWTLIEERTAQYLTWTRQFKQAVRDMPERSRRERDPYSPTSRRLAALS